jgi:hypothetical protein
MDLMNDDEQFNRWLGDAAREYHDLGTIEVPREDMWAAVRQELDHVAADTVVSPQPLPFRRTGRWFRVVAPYAAAAVLLLAVGIAIGRSGAPAAPAAPGVVAAVPQATAVMYERATQAHLGRAEVLLSTVAQQSSPGNDAVARFARDVLTDTRLLLDSPAADNVARRALLQDLEMLLVQIVQLSSTSTDDHRQFLDRALERGDLMTRIRLATPNGVSGT